MVITALSIKLESAVPVLERRYIIRGGRRIVVLKFRTTLHQPQNGQPVWRCERVTRVGWFLSYTRIDRHSPDSRPVGGDCPSLEVPRQRNSIAANPGGSQIGGSPASQGRNSLLCLHQGAPLPSLYVASDPIFLVMPALAAPAAGRSATGFPGTSAAAPRLRPSETSRSDRG